MIAVLQPAAVSAESCLQVENVELWDFLNIREKPSASSTIVGAIAPGHGEPLELTGACVSRAVRPTARWCPVTILSLSAVWWAGGREADFGARLALASICLVLIPSHVMLYEMPGVVAGLWALGRMQEFSPLAGISLVFAALVLRGLLSAARVGNAPSAGEPALKSPA